MSYAYYRVVEFLILGSQYTLLAPFVQECWSSQCTRGATASCRGVTCIASVLVSAAWVANAKTRFASTDADGGSWGAGVKGGASPEGESASAIEHLKIKIKNYSTTTCPTDTLCSATRLRCCSVGRVTRCKQPLAQAYTCGRHERGGPAIEHLKIKNTFIT